MINLSSSLYRAHRRGKFFIFTFVSLTFALTAQSLETRPPKVVAKIFLMGEIHDNSHGHRLRLEHVMQLIEQGHRPVVAMEQFDRENQATLDLALTSCRDVDCVLDKAATPGWEWRFYKPFVQLALDKKVTLIAANLSNVDVRKAMTDGFSAVFSAQAIDTYKLNQIAPQLLNAQIKAIQEGHCNMLPVQAIAPMVRGQIARDVWMASVVNGVQNQTVMLIAGNGHIRKDAGVFQWLSKDKQGLTHVLGYVERADRGDADWFDQAYTVPEVEREDPCQVFTRKPDKK
jgi:uncharacterized iron-regulated protein